MIRTSRLFCVSLIAILGLVFSSNTAFASLLLFQGSQDLDGVSSCYQDLTSPQRLSEVQFFVPVGGTLGGVSMVAVASTTQLFSMGFFQGVNFLAATSSMVFENKSVVTWDFSNTGVTLSPHTNYRISVPSSGAATLQWFGTTATRTDITILRPNGNFCTFTGGAPWLEIDTTAERSQFTIHAPIIDPTCGISDIGACVGQGLKWAFYPSAGSFDAFISIKDAIKNKAPFGYLTSAVGAISGISATSAPAFALATSAPMMTHIFSPLRAGIVWLIYFAALFWIYKRVTNINV